MSRKILVLTLASAVVSAILLFVGTTVMGFFSPVSADSLPALVLGKRVTNDTALQAQSGADDTPTPTPFQPAPTETALPTATFSPQETPAQQPTPIPAVSLTIAQLLANPGAYLNQMVSLSGMVNVISRELFLLNDGTGQIVVDVEEDGVAGALSNGMTVTVVGRFDDYSKGGSYKIEACTVTDSSGKVWSNQCHNHDEDDDTSLTSTPHDDKDDDHKSTLQPTRTDDHDDDHDRSGKSTPKPTQSDDDHEDDGDHRNKDD
ncbi:hypothetical protein [Anaerolinea thermophila]|uniref:Uncharacterized protein n=1 Tax=Anaerolinea thermophila (strain DSM 14523 / JCM 11388 / NBRC 100420 / UNI-1) TaxID=926569 RepID=E8MYG0_ANATU|nr:hypothetical protein [Anaerolinea thermophila]BAJ62105.1 hypothetical protein ANT_00710 [Anaerolinea thermophila UNI-1]